MPTTSPIFPAKHEPESTSVLVVNPTPSITTLTTAEVVPEYPTPTAAGFEDNRPDTLATTSSASNNGDHLHFSNDMYPLYKYPMLYEPNYPSPNGETYTPGVYAANAPEVDIYSRPSVTMDLSHDNMTIVRPPPKPMFGSGYGNGFAYGHPESHNVQPTSTAVINDPNYRNQFQHPMPTSMYTPLNNTPSMSFQPQPPSYGDRPPPPPTSQTSQRNPYHTSEFMGFTHPPEKPAQGPTPRPASSTHSVTSYGHSSNGHRYDVNFMRRNDSSGISDDKRINTYFNPEDYLNGSKKSKFSRFLQYIK